MERINPVIVAKSSETARVPEGSIAPGAPMGYFERPIKVTVEAQDRNGNPITINTEGFLAATLCHEIDHLDSVLFSDKFVESGSG